MKLKVRVYHSTYGCETGCCGHVLEIKDGKTSFQVGGFDFMHSYQGLSREEAIELAKEEIKKHFPECLDSIDWDSFEIDKYVTDRDMC